MLRFLLAAIFCVLSGSLPALDRDPSAFTLAVAADRADCIYQRDEAVTFTISVSLKDVPGNDAKPGRHPRLMPAPRWTADGGRCRVQGVNAGQALA